MVETQLCKLLDNQIPGTFVGRTYSIFRSISLLIWCLWTRRAIYFEVVVINNAQFHKLLFFFLVVDTCRYWSNNYPGFRALFLVYFFERTRPAVSMRPPCLIYLSTSNEVRPRERSDRGRFLPLGPKASSYRGAYRVPLFNLSMCEINVRPFCWLRQLYDADFHKPGIYGSGRVWANAWDVFFRAPSRDGRGRRAAAAYVVFCRWGGFFRVSFFDLFFLRTHTAYCKYEATCCLIYISTSTGVRTGCHYLICLLYTSPSPRD